ncbi:hypothetical protein [uncultured Muribaculum sp.]|uniref:hypothetical protein n=1 Tax=uncultured Muribaculum sp. TaxID=1918613 RepID=UPI00266FFA09|nr:hypothetical protein [uncultured Muribaculum sp.]
MKKNYSIVVVVIVFVTFIIGCNSLDTELLSNSNKIFSRASTSLLQEEAFKIGLKYLCYENGKYQFNLSWSEAQKYGISYEDYNIMSQDVESANTVVCKLKNSDEVDDYMFEILECDTIYGKDFPVELDSLISLNDTQRIIRKSYGEMSGGGSNLYYITTVVCVPFGQSNIMFGLGSSGWFNTYVGGVVNGYTNFGYSMGGSYCWFNISVPGPGVYTVRILVSGNGNVYYNTFTY